MSFIIEGVQSVFQFLYQMLGDYGLTIIAFTIGFKLILLPLDIKQQKGQKKQAELNVKINALKEKYKNNKEKLNQEMATLMSKEGTPLGGCLLSLVQLPVMYCLFEVIHSGLIEGTTSYLLPWIESLVVRDPYFILPVVSILVQSIPYLYPRIRMFQGMDLPKTNRSMVFVMILITGGIGITLPSGISLYYLVTSLFNTIRQFIFLYLDARKMKMQMAE